MLEDKAAAYNAFAWLFNVSTSILIVFVNKILMGASGYMFNFGAHTLNRSLCAATMLSMTGLTDIHQSLCLSTMLSCGRCFCSNVAYLVALPMPTAVGSHWRGWLHCE